MAAVTICSDFGAQKNKVWHYFHCFPIYFPWSDGTRCHDLRFLKPNFKPTFSLSIFTFIKRLLSSSSLSAIRVVSSAYLRLIFVLAILIPACMYKCDSWTINKAEHWRIHAFKLWCWRRLLRVPWTARRSNQSNLKKISAEYSLEGLMLKLKLQYFGHLMWRADSFGKDPDAGRLRAG